MNPIAVALIAALAACTPLTRSSRARRVIGGALVALAFGAASAVIGLSPERAGTPGISDAIDGGLVLAGMLALLLAAFDEWRAGARVTSIALVSGVVAFAFHERSVPLVAGPGAVLVAAAVTGIGALGARRRGAPSRAGPPARPILTPGRIATALGGVGLAALAPNAWLVIAGALAAAAAVAPVSAALAAVGLVPLLWFLHTVAGPVGLSVATLSAIPLSPAAEPVAAALLALGAFALFGLWPVRRFASPLLGVAGAAVVIRLGGPLAPALADWRTVLVPLGVIGLAHASLARDQEEALAAWAWLGAVTGAALGGWLLAVGAAITAVWHARTADAAAGVGTGRVVASALCTVVAVGATLALSSLLRVEVVYTVLAALLSAALLLRLEPRPR